MIEDIEALVSSIVDRFGWDLKTAYDQDLDDILIYLDNVSEQDENGNKKTHKKKEEVMSMADFLTKKGGVSSIL